MEVQKVKEISSDILDMVSRYFVGNKVMLRKMLRSGEDPPREGLRKGDWVHVEEDPVHARPHAR